MKQQQTLLSACALALVLTGGMAWAAPLTVDTSALAGTAGFLDFQFNPDTSGTTPLDATVLLSGDGLGAGGMSLANTGASNELILPYTFTDSYTFTPTFLPAPTLNADEGSTLQLLLLDGTQTTLPTTDTLNNTVATVGLGSDGTVGPAQTFALAPTSGAVPEPGTWALLSLGLLPLGALAVRRRA